MMRAERNVALPVLPDKIDRLSEKLDAKIETLETKTNARIDGAVTTLRTEIKEANDKREAGDAALSDKIDKLAEISLKNQAQLKSIGWLVSIVTVIASAISIARTLNWI